MYKSQLSLYTAVPRKATLNRGLHVTLPKGTIGGQSSTLLSDWSSKYFITINNINSFMVHLDCPSLQEFTVRLGYCKFWAHCISLINNFADYLWALLGTVLDNLSQNSCTHFVFSYIIQSIGIYPKSWPCYFFKCQDFSPRLIFHSCHAQVIWLPLRISTLNKKTWHLECGKKSLKLEWNDHRVYLNEHSINHFLNKTIPIRSFFPVKGKIKY